jgi:uncharacterized protein DUF2867
VKLSNDAHQGYPWRITRIAPDFKLLDAWDPGVRGSRGEFNSFIDTMNALDIARSGTPAVRALFRLRSQLGRWFKWNDGGWDDDTVKLAIPGCTETTLGARLPEDLKNTVSVGKKQASKFRPLYQTDNEWAAEISNRTVHAIKHLVWIDEGGGCYRGQLGVYVKPRGWFGRFYLALIGPFRRAIVYPAGIARIKNVWQTRRS